MGKFKFKNKIKETKVLADTCVVDQHQPMTGAGTSLNTECFLLSHGDIENMGLHSAST